MRYKIRFNFRICNLSASSNTKEVQKLNFRRNASETKRVSSHSQGYSCVKARATLLFVVTNTPTFAYPQYIENI